MTGGDAIRVLFVCTGNSCRSQMAEALLRHHGGPRFEAFSAGTHPAGYVHPLAEEALRRLGVPLEGQTSKSWALFADTALDVVITLCDEAAGEACPAWTGDPLTVPWPLPDPVGHPGSEEDRRELAWRVAQRLEAKIRALTALDFTAPRAKLREQLAFLGDI